MKDSLLRDRAGENESAAGAVDKSVVNWLMHVISGKDPLGLGINDASSNDAAPEEAKPQKPILREETKKNDPAAQSLSVSAEDLCGAPVIPILIASKPVYEVVDDEPESSAVVAVTEGTKKPKPDPEPEVSEAGRFKQMFGLKVVGGAKSSPKDASTDPKSVAAELLREGSQYNPPELTKSVLSSFLSAPKDPDSQQEGFDPLELVRDPDYYEEKLRARKTLVAAPEVEFVPSDPEPVRSVIDAKGDEQEFELMQVVHEAHAAVDVPAAATIPDPFAGIDFSTKPIEAEVVAPAAPTAAIPDPFAGIDFPPEPTQVQDSEPVVAAPATPDPFAGIDFLTPSEAEVAREPVAVPAKPEVTEIKSVLEVLRAGTTEPEATAAVPVAEPTVEPEAAKEAAKPEEAAVQKPEAFTASTEAAPESQVAEAVRGVPTAQAVPDPFAGIDSPVERAAEIAVPELIATAEALIAVPEIVERAPQPEVTAAQHPDETAAPRMESDPEIVEDAASPKSAKVVEFAPRTDEQAGIAEPEAALTDLSEEATGPVSVEEPVEPAFEAQPEMVVPEAEPAAAATDTAASEAVADPIIAVPGEMKPSTQELMGREEVALVPEFAANAEESLVSEPKTGRQVAASSSTHAEDATRSEVSWMGEVSRPPTVDATFSARDYNRQKTHDMQPTRELAQANSQTEAVDPIDAVAKPEDLTAALKTLMQLGSVLPLAARLTPAPEGEPISGATGVDSQEVRQEVSGLRLLQYEIKTTVQDHSMHLKRLEDQLARIQESAELDSVENASVVDNVKSTAKMIRLMGISLGVMFLVLILLVGMILMHVK